MRATSVGVGAKYIVPGEADERQGLADGGGVAAHSASGFRLLRLRRRERRLRRGLGDNGAGLRL